MAKAKNLATQIKELEDPIPQGKFIIGVLIVGSAVLTWDSVGRFRSRRR